MQVVSSESPPFESVPNDILQEILLHCLPTLSIAISLAPSQAPTLLTHVCQRWRRVALTFPQLWKCMRLEVRRAELDDTKLRTFAAAAARAKSAPRNLQLVIKLPLLGLSRLNTGSLHPMPNVVHKLFDTPVSSLTRLALRGVPAAQIHDLPRGLFPALDTLILHLEGTDKDIFQRDVKGPLTTFSDAPALRRVGLGPAGSFPSEAYASSNIALPWQ
ncbi:hypothetical protein FA13DRAFT_112329 [Coprinellus micaceus]|uniref:Uncharacterized protein n=1 Tax=Coprinellus micaceus TaxID=71717 RepID=A0A4Y7THX0_COPMI|nr:hypothetical protein FA13DRAFT_112329 [Coprinellus micaceus]